MYTGSVHKDWTKIPVEIVMASDKYELPGLKDSCDQHLDSTCTMKNAMELFNTAELHGLTTARVRIGRFIKTNMDGIVARNQGQKPD